MNDYVVTIGNDKREVILKEDGKASIDGKIFDYELTSLNEHTYLLRIEDKTYQLSANKINSDEFSIYVEGRNIEATVRSALQEKAIKLLEQKSKSSHKTEVKAPMPGMILKIKKKSGDAVKQGESVMILEAMKMENDLRSPASGTIKSIFIKEGSAVEKGAALFTIE